VIIPPETRDFNALTAIAMMHRKLSTVLHINAPSDAANKLQKNPDDSIDPIIDHLTRSRPFRNIIRGLVLLVLCYGVYTVVFVAMDVEIDRLYCLSLVVPAFHFAVMVATAHSMTSRCLQ
jgi:hypothetical protein